MSEKPHMLSFGPLADVPLYHAAHVLPPKIADTPTLECACGCGLKLFIYYRVYSVVEVPREQPEERDEK